MRVKKNMCVCELASTVLRTITYRLSVFLKNPAPDVRTVAGDVVRRACAGKELSTCACRPLLEAAASSGALEKKNFISGSWMRPRAYY
jgi:hypothetical protein